jgi:hypothetical protein
MVYLCLLTWCGREEPHNQCNSLTQLTHSRHQHYREVHYDILGSPLGPLGNNQGRVLHFGCSGSNCHLIVAKWFCLLDYDFGAG